MLLRQASFGARACARATRAASVRMPVRTAVVSVEPDETPYAALLADRALTSRVSEPVRKRWIEEHARWTEYQAKVEEFVKAAMGSMGLSGSDVDSAADLLDSLADGADGSDSAGAASGLGLDPATVSILDGVPDEALNYLFRQRTRHFREVRTQSPWAGARRPGAPYRPTNPPLTLPGRLRPGNARAAADLPLPGPVQEGVCHCESPHARGIVPAVVGAAVVTRVLCAARHAVRRRSASTTSSRRSCACTTRTTAASGGARRPL